MMFTGVPNEIEQKQVKESKAKEITSVKVSPPTKVVSTPTSVPTPSSEPVPTTTPTPTPIPSPTATPTPKPTQTPKPTPKPTKAPDYTKQAAQIYKDVQHYLSVGRGMKNVRESKSLTANCGLQMRKVLPDVQALRDKADKLHSDYIKTATERPFRYVKLATAGTELQLCVTCSPRLAPRACKQTAQALKDYTSGEY